MGIVIRSLFQKARKIVDLLANAPLRVIFRVILSATLKSCNDLRFVVVVYPLSLAASTLMFILIEGQRWIDGLYWSVVTSVTVGYGDFSPKTDFGKLAAIAFMFFWFVLAAVFIVNLLRHIVQDPHAWTHDEQVEVLEGIRTTQANQTIIHQNMLTLAAHLGILEAMLPLEQPESDTVQTINA